MESKWRLNVWKLVGNTFAQWSYPGGFPYSYVHLVAELDTPILQAGLLWTHVLKMTPFGSGTGPYLARFHDANVLDEVRRLPFFGNHFPYGFAVEPD